MIVAATGHRPKFLPCKYNERHPWLVDLKSRLLDWLQFNDPECIISGMAIGWDTWVADAAIQLNIPLKCYIPFPKQNNKWPKEARQHYNYIIGKADDVVHISKSYSKQAFLKRDRAMVDDADQILALLSPEINNGGTFYTVDYANSQNKNIINFWRDYKYAKSVTRR